MERKGVFEAIWNGRGSEPNLHDQTTAAVARRDEDMIEVGILQSKLTRAAAFPLRRRALCEFTTRAEL